MPGSDIIVVGVGSNALDEYDIPRSEGEEAYSGTGLFTVIAPRESGDYPVYAMLTRAETTVLAFSDYESSVAQIPYRYIRLGTIRVLPQ